MKEWHVYSKKADFKAVGEKFGIDQVTARILRNRDLVEEEDIRLFLSGTGDDLFDPHLLKDADLLVDILMEKIEEGKQIRVIGDYDIDGVMSSYILKKALLRCGGKVGVEIPDRIADGYGLNRNLIARAAEAGMDTIITCDNGIAAIEEITYAKERGMTVLVTDHHEIPFYEEEGRRVERVSLADAVVNPHRQDCAYPNKNLCGAAVAWKVVCILYERMGIPRQEAEDFLENVAFATVGDIMPQQGENRILVKEGLKRIRHTKNVGMRALIAQCGLEAEKIDSYHFGYVLGPCINASGRLDTALPAMELFFEEDEEKAAAAAGELVALNEARKDLTRKGFEEAKEVYVREGIEEDAVAVLYLPDVHESIAGIIAGRMREFCDKPTFILTDAENGVKGSGRSIPGYSMYEQLCKCGELLDKFGGHPMAAGLSLPRENVDAFRKKINAVCPIPKEEMKNVIYIDVAMPLDYVTPELVRELEILAPFGQGNERPVFAERDLAIERMWVIGKKQNVLRLWLSPVSGRRFEGIFFGDIPAFFDYLKMRFGEDAWKAAMAGKKNAIRLLVIYKPSIHCYAGEESLQFEIKSYK